MKKLIQKLIGIDKVINQQENIIHLLGKIANSTKDAADLKRKSNNAYHIK